jgi:hypothetical protein
MSTLSRAGGAKASAGTAAGAGAGAGPSGSFATADAALKNKVKTMEEVDEQRKLARLAERDLQERLQRELEGERRPSASSASSSGADADANADAGWTASRFAAPRCLLPAARCLPSARLQTTQAAYPFSFPSQPLNPPSPYPARAASRLSALQVQESWRKIMRTVKAEELRHELEVLAQAHEREVERRDAAIQAQLAELDEAETTFEQALRQNLRAVDRLIEIQDARLLSLERDFRREVRALEEEFAAEREAVMARHRAFKAEQLHVAKAIREDEEAKAQAAATDFEQLKEALKRRNLEQIHVLQSEMDAVMEGLERKLEDAHLAYLTNTDHRTQDFKVLSERGQHDTQMNERQQRALKRLNRLLQLWRSKAGNNVRECEERNETLEEERVAVGGHLERLKQDMGRVRASTLADMKALASAAAAAKQELADNTALAQRLLGMAEAMRSYESASEKVDPFAATRGTLPSQTVGAGAELVAAARTASGAAAAAAGGAAAGAALQQELALLEAEAAGEGLSSGLAPGTADALEEADALHNFYGRYNKALLETLAMERQRERLRAENAELQHILQQTLDSMAVTPSAVDGPNALLVVNGRVTLNRAAPPVRQVVRPVAIEAAIVAGTYARGGAPLR